MKRIQLILIILFLTATGYAQNWKPYKIDDSVQVSLPEGFTRKEAEGQVLINAQGSFGNILVTKLSDNPKSTPDIEKEKHLQKYYDDFVKKIRSSAKEGTISEERDTTLGNLMVKDLTLAVDSGSGKQFRNIRVMHVNSATYTFQFLYRDIHRVYAAPELTTFFNSIKITPQADLASQFTNPENTTGRTPGSIKYLPLWIILGVLVLLAPYFILRRRGHIQT
ncbi:hypothetical protein [Desertivirga brevis]|uniref:hypothetical protein n=1 Tax=Desertivirga brevis TaxID=2810310 RepID=UPI001A976FB2|nr:hypothetical protein [Pedobacter sp. SYSU D00873]